MRKVLGLIASALLVFSATSASAVLAVDANIVGVFTDTTFAIPVAGSSVSANGDEATATLAAGQGILLTIDIANLNGDTVASLFSTIIFQGDQIIFLGGTAIPEILVSGPIMAPTSLARIAQPGIKVSAPNPQGVAGDVWLQATAYASLVGTDGTGPNIAAVQLFFQVTGAVGGDQIDFFLTQTASDVISGVPTLNGAVINVPEPGTALLMGLGLAGLAGAGRRRS